MAKKNKRKEEIMLNVLYVVILRKKMKKTNKANYDCVLCTYRERDRCEKIS